jgi:hypothetical protein
MVEQGHLEEAVALYRGPLLDGFHISRSVEFETWLDGERAALQHARSGMRAQPRVQRISRAMKFPG